MYQKVCKGSLTKEERIKRVGCRHADELIFFCISQCYVIRSPVYTWGGESMRI